jgi:hypothetical protein
MGVTHILLQFVAPAWPHSRVKDAKTLRSHERLRSFDTNVLVYAADETSPFHHRSRDLRDRGLSGQTSLCVCPQVLIEF